MLISSILLHTQLLKESALGEKFLLESFTYLITGSPRVHQAKLLTEITQPTSILSQESVILVLRYNFLKVTHPAHFGITSPQTLTPPPQSE